MKSLFVIGDSVNDLVHVFVHNGDACENSSAWISIMAKMIAIILKAPLCFGLVKLLDVKFIHTVFFKFFLFYISLLLNHFYPTLFKNILLSYNFFQKSPRHNQW